MFIYIEKEVATEPKDKRNCLAAILFEQDLRWPAPRSNGLGFDKDMRCNTQLNYNQPTLRSRLKNPSRSSYNRLARSNKSDQNLVLMRMSPFILILIFKYSNARSLVYIIMRIYLKKVIWLNHRRLPCSLPYRRHSL